MEKLCLFLVLALLGNIGLCLDPPNSTPKDQLNSTPKVQPDSTPKGQPDSTPKSQPYSTPKGQPNRTPKGQPDSTPKGQPNSTLILKSKTTPAATTFIPMTTSSVDDCIRTCPVTPEYNPVCGSNNVTYSNPGRLLCAQACGVDVKLVRHVSCPPPARAPSV